MDPLPIDRIVASLRDWRTWVVLLIAAAFGVLGGYAHHLFSPEGNTAPVFAFLVVGAAAALVALLFVNPSDGVRLVALSVAAGWAGQALLDASAAQVRASLAQAEARTAKEEGQRAVAVGRRAIDVAEKAMEKKAQAEPNQEAARSTLKELSNQLDELERTFQQR